MKRRCGFTLLEALLTISIMGGMMGVLLAVFAAAGPGYKLGSTRLDLQSDLRRILGPLRRDLFNSAFQSLSVLGRIADVAANPPYDQPRLSVHRDALCMNALSRGGTSPAEYSPTSGRPMWDCYVVYFATRDDPNGNLIRMVLRDTSVSDIAQPIPSLNEADLSLSNANLLNNDWKELSSQVLEFSASLDEGNQLVRFHLKIRGAAGRREGKSTAEVLEIESTLRPDNTWPRL